MTRRECLKQAMECVLQDRNSQYGEPEDSFGMIAGMWTAYLGVAVDKVDVAMMMGMLKMARIRGNKHYGDGYIDLAGYAACAAECSGIGTEIPPWAKLVEKEAEEVEKAFGKPDGGCCQKGKVHWPDEPEFKPGDAVELWDKARDKWMPCVYLRKAVDPGYSIVQSSDCRELLVSSFYLRKAEANHPENPESSKRAEGCEELVQLINKVNHAIYGEKKEQD